MTQFGTRYMKTKTFILIFIALLTDSQDGQGQQVSKVDAEASYKKLLTELEDLERLSDEKTLQIESLKKKNKQLVTEIERLTAKLSMSGNSVGSDRMQPVREDTSGFGRQVDPSMDKSLKPDDMEKYFGVFEILRLDLGISQRKPRIAVLKPIGQRSIGSLSEADVRFQAQTSIRYQSYSFGSTFDHGESVWRWVSISNDTITLSCVQGADKGCTIKMQFTDANSGSIWCDNARWPKTDLDQPVQYSFQRQKPALGMRDN